MGRNRRNPVRLACLAVAALAGSALPASASVEAPEIEASAGAFVSGPCPSDVFDPTMVVTCGSLTVPEDRTDSGSRNITIAAAIVHAAAESPRPDPIVFVTGGPSFGAISPFVMGAYFAGAEYVEDRDVILVDTRGTGLAEPRLGCPEMDDARVSGFYAKPFVDSSWNDDMRVAMAACRDRLTSSGIDLSAYNSAESAADLDDLRRALGYDKWNVVALSADGVLALTYMRLFPDGIRSAILDSAQSNQHQPGLDYFRGLTDQLETIFAGCAANAACNAKYPDIRTLFFDLVHQLQRHPVNISFPRFQPQPVTLRLDGVFFYFDALFGIFPGDRFEPEHIHDLLDELWRATHGELRAVYRERFGTGPLTSDANDFVAEGKTLSYLCHDLVAFITPADLAQAAQDVPELAPHILSPNFDLPFGPAGCDIWGVGSADLAQHEPVSSDIPTLVLVGEYDIGVTPNISRQIAPTLPNAHHFEFPAGAHGQLLFFQHASDCARSIAGQFLAAPDDAPDASCIATVAPFDFTPPG